MNKLITVEAFVRADGASVWTFWNTPEHITHWMHASDTWECTKAESDLKAGGRFCFTLGAKDKSVSFDLSGTYTAVEAGVSLAYTLDDNRTVKASFTAKDGGTRIVQTFEMETENPEEMQREGWQATLDNFKSYVEQSLQK
jgi:uncharacterized protein YndB with AHSA1/START domain